MENDIASTFAPSGPPFVMSSRANSFGEWVERARQDLRPTPGRLSTTLRLMLATILTLLVVLVLQVPFASVALYFVFFVGRESPAISLRSLFTIVPILAAVAVELGIVILTDNDPMARLLGIAVVSFLAGLTTMGTTLPALGSTWAFVFVTLISFWETHAPASRLVTHSLWVITALSIPILASIGVEYVFGARHPADLLDEEIAIRWQAFIAMFGVFAANADRADRLEAVTQVSRLATTGQGGMQALYNKIVERNLETGSLMIGARVRITMLAQLMDLAAAVGSAPYANDPESLSRYKRIAADAQDAFHATQSQQPAHEIGVDAHSTLLERVEGMLHTILSMPTNAEHGDRLLVAIPAKHVPVMIPGGFTKPANVAFALKLSLCATVCYILYHALGYPGISTCVITVFITGLSTTGAIKQKFTFRLFGSMIGGLIFGLGAAVFLFPSMDSVTSLVILVSAVTFIAGWIAQGRRFSYVGMQIAFSFFLVAFEGFSIPTQLAPARDRLIGILLALVVMWVVFDQIWPVRTITQVRSALGVILRDGAKLFRLPENVGGHDGVFQEANALRDEMGRTIATLRTMNDAVEYEFGADRESHIEFSRSVLRGALTAAALFWNQTVFLWDERDRDLLNEPRIVELRHRLAARMDVMADALAADKSISPSDASQFFDPSWFASLKSKEYAQNAVARFRELEDNLQSIGVAEL